MGLCSSREQLIYHPQRENHYYLLSKYQLPQSVSLPKESKLTPNMGSPSFNYDIETLARSRSIQK